MDYLSHGPNSLEYSGQFGRSCVRCMMCLLCCVSRLCGPAGRRELAAVLVFLLLSVPNSLLGGSSIALAGNDDFPYELQTGRELLLLGLGAGLASGGLILQSNQSPLQQEDLADLSISDINRLDRGATDNWSPSAD